MCSVRNTPLQKQLKSNNHYHQYQEGVAEVRVRDDFGEDLRVTHLAGRGKTAVMQDRIGQRPGPVGRVADFCSIVL
jgi:hypothetical protein